MASAIGFGEKARQFHKTDLFYREVIKIENAAPHELLHEKVLEGIKKSSKNPEMMLQKRLELIKEEKIKELQQKIFGAGEINELS